MARTAPRPLESSVEAAVRRYARKNGIYTRKFSSPSRRGVPDRVFIKHGIVVFMELKRPGEEPTPLQYHELKEIDDAGGIALWADTATAAINMLEIYLNPLL